MQLLVSNRAEIQSGKLLIDSPHVIISIHDPAQPAAKIPADPRLLAVLTLAFDDCRHAIRDGDAPELWPMTVAQAKEIRDFVLLHRGHVAAIVVHCEQGFSRSPAVAAAIAEFVGVDPKPFFQNYTPNWYVYHTLLDAFEE